MPNTKKTSVRKTTTLGINKISETTTILDIAKAFELFASSITEIKLVNVRNEYRNALIHFNSVETCEKAKEIGSVKLSGAEYGLYFAHNTSYPNLNISASEKKVYVKYPTTESFDEICKMFSGIEIQKPEKANNYFFATCSNMEEQCDIIKKFNNKKVNGGNLTVKVALDRVRKRAPFRPTVASE